MLHVVICDLLDVMCYMLCYMLYVICYMLDVICYMLYVACDMLHDICYLLYVICYMLHVTCYLLPAMCYKLHVICHILHVIGCSVPGQQSNMFTQAGPGPRGLNKGGPDCQAKVAHGDPNWHPFQRLFCTISEPIEIITLYTILIIYLLCHMLI